jgi:hypothetical protein
VKTLPLQVKVAEDPIEEDKLMLSLHTYAVEDSALGII